MGADDRSDRGLRPPGPPVAVIALGRAARRGHVEALCYLIAVGTPVDGRDAHGRTPLHGAARCGQAGAVRLLLAFGADPNARDPLGISPVDWARAAGHGRVVRLLTLAGGRGARGAAARRHLRAES